MQISSEIKQLLR